LGAREKSGFEKIDIALFDRLSRVSHKQIHVLKSAAFLAFISGFLSFGRVAFAEQPGLPQRFY